MPEASSPFVALQHRNYRLPWSSQLLSMAGSLMQAAAVLWHISLLVPPDRRGIALGMVGLVRIVPIVSLSLISGVVADALDRRKLMLVTQSGMAIAAVLLALVTFRGGRSVWPIYLLTAITSAFSSFDAPARQSLVPNLVPREHLANAISLNAIMFQTASVLGPALGGLIIGSLGVAWVYALNAATFLLVILALLMMRDVPERAGGEKGAPSAPATTPASSSPSCGPPMKKIMLTPVMRPRMASGVLSWRMTLRITMLTVSVAPVSARHRKVIAKLRERPNTTVATP